eukprot:TRINITY_DN11172_c0_g1_i1.p1 TRINITY_DN11172_c0_g1~~TRINITY_DN11172_c0_g1_i1.p1  ORF type:complete len:446 (+),score=122.11 TRINITY_DN11172_c0_g1_i1:27-1364(+)
MLTFLFGILMGFLTCLVCIASFFLLGFDKVFSAKKSHTYETKSVPKPSEAPPVPPRLRSATRCGKQTGLGHIWEIVWQEMMQHKGIQNMLIEKIQTKINEKNNTDFLGEIKVEYFKAGPDAPVISNPEFVNTGGDDVLCYFDFFYANGISAKLNTELFINWPSPKFATCNASIIITLNSLQGRVCLEIPEGSDPLCKIGFLHNPQCNFSINSEVKELYGYGNIPGRASEIITKKVEEKILNRMLVRPRGLEFHIPIPKERKMGMKIIRDPNHPDHNLTPSSLGLNLDPAAVVAEASVGLKIEDFLDMSDLREVNPGTMEFKTVKSNDASPRLLNVHSQSQSQPQISPRAGDVTKSTLSATLGVPVQRQPISPRGEATKSSFSSTLKSHLSTAKSMYTGKSKESAANAPPVPKRIDRSTTTGASSVLPAAVLPIQDDISKGNSKKL